MFKYSHLLGVAIAFAAVQISNAQSVDAYVDVSTSFGATLGTDITSSVSGFPNTSGPYNFGGLPAYTTGDGVNYPPSAHQGLDTDGSGNITGGANEAGVESAAYTNGSAYQNQGIDYHITFTNNSMTTAENVTVTMASTENMSATSSTPGGIAKINAYSGYFYVDGGVETEAYFNNSLDQSGSTSGPDDFGATNPAILNFGSFFSGTGYVGATSSSTFSVGAGQSVIVDFYASGSSTAAVPEPPVALLGIAGLGVLLLRRKSA